MSVFSADSKFMRFLTGVFDEIAPNILFLVCCLPIVTIGASASALITAHRRVMYSAAPCASTFFKCFRRSCRRMIPAWLIMLVLMGLFGYSSYFGAKFQMETRYISMVALGLTACVSSVLFQFDSHFDCSLGQLLLNSVMMFFSSPIRSVLIAVFTWLPVLLLLSAGPKLILDSSILWFLFYFSLIAALNAWIMKMPFKLLEQHSGASFLSMEDEDARDHGIEPEKDEE